MAPSGRPGLGGCPSGTARENGESRGSGADKPAGWAKTACRPGFTPSETEPGFLAWLAETHGSSRPLAGMSRAWILFRKTHFIPGAFFKAPPVMLNVCLEKNSALPPWLSCLKHISKLVLKSFLVKSYKSSLIINLQRKRCFYLESNYLKKKKA